MSRAWAVALALVLSGASGCDDEVPVTPQALAYVAASHAGEPDYAVVPVIAAFEQFEGEVVEAELRTGVEESTFGDSLRVMVGKQVAGQDPTTCEGREPYPYCAPLEDGGALTWTVEDPGEDPGHVEVAVRKGDVTVVVVSAGPPITQDPRTMELPVDVELLEQIARDDRVDLTTTQDAVDAGEELTYWLDEPPWLS